MTTATFDRLHDSDGTPTLKRFIAYKIGSMLDRPKNRARSQIQNYIRIILHIAGFVCLTIAGFTWNPIAGFVVAGLSCFIFSLLSTGGDETAERQNGPHRR